MRYQFELTGVTPLIMHWDNLEGAEQIASWMRVTENKKRSKAGDDRSPAWLWKTYLYNDGKHVVLPEDNMRSSLMKGGAQISTGKGKSTFKSISQSGLLFDGPFFEFHGSRGPIKMADIDKIDGDWNFDEHMAAAVRLGFRLLGKRARIGQAKHVRIRPIFDSWRAAGVVEVINPQITQDVLQQIFFETGRIVGLGDWRPASPSSPGPYGRFTAKITPVK